MQAIVRIASPGKNISSTVGEAAFSNSKENAECSQESSTNLPLTELETVEERTHSERKNITRGRERNTELSRSTTNSSHVLKLFRKKKTKSARLKKACEAVFLASVIITTVSFQAVPTIVYFTKAVSACMQQFRVHNNAFLV